MEIFKLFGSILVDSSKAEESISKTGEKAEGLGSKLGAGIVMAGKWAAGLGAAGAAVGAAMMGAASKVAGAADEVDKASRRAGTSAENWQKLNYAMGQSGIDSATLERTMIKNQKAVNEAAEGTGKASEAYSTLGVSIRDADGSLREADSVYQDTLKSLADLEDKNLRNALANDIFGKSYGDLAPILDSGSKGIDDLTSRAEKLGLVLSQETIDAGVKFGDTMDDVKQVGGAVFNVFAAKLLPILQSFLDWVIGHMPEIQATVKVAFDVISTVVGTAYGWFKEYLLPIFQALFEWAEAHMPQIKAVVGAVFGAISDIAQSLWKIFSENLIPILQALWDFISPTFPLIEAVVKVTFKAIVKTVQTVVDIFDKVTESIKKAIEWLTFWKDEDGKEPAEKKSTKKEKKNGSHAAGLPFVPYDGYVAELHKGETVLNADNTSELLSALSNISSGNSSTQNISLSINLDGKTLAREMYEHILKESARRGKALGGVV